MTDAPTADTAALRGELEKTSAPRAQQTVYELLERMKPELERALPAQIGADRFARTVLTELRRTPKLLECSPQSLLGAMMLAAQLGLEPGPLGHAYLVPFGGEVTFIVGYRGMVHLAYNSGLVTAVGAAIVYDGDSFAFRQGTRPFLDHTPAGPPADRAMTHAYAVAKLKGGGGPFVVTYPEDWARAMKRSPASKRPESPWQTDYAAMVRKTAIRRLQPLLPQSPQLALALAADEQPAPPVDVAVSASEPV